MLLLLLLSLDIAVIIVVVVVGVAVSVVILVVVTVVIVVVVVVILVVVLIAVVVLVIVVMVLVVIDVAVMLVLVSPVGVVVIVVLSAVGSPLRAFLQHHSGNIHQVAALPSGWREEREYRVGLTGNSVTAYTGGNSCYQHSKLPSPLAAAWTQGPWYLRSLNIYSYFFFSTTPPPDPPIMCIRFPSDNVPGSIPNRSDQ